MPKKHDARSSVSRVRVYSFPRIAAALLFAGCLLFIQYRHSSFIVKATTHQSQAYTELYFSDPSKLPSLAYSSGSLPLNFTIHNLEGRTIAYTYQVEFTDINGHTSQLQERQLAVANNGTASVQNDDVLLPSFKGRAEITVVLQGHPEAIHFWIDSES